MKSISQLIIRLLILVSLLIWVVSLTKITSHSPTGLQVIAVSAAGASAFFFLILDKFFSDPKKAEELMTTYGAILTILLGVFFFYVTHRSETWLVLVVAAPMAICWVVSKYMMQRARIQR